MSWYALYTRPRHEKKVFDQLLEKDIKAFLPVQRELRQWKDRRKWIEAPLFSGYVFVNIELKNKIYALETRGVVRMIGFGGQPTQIPDWQIEQLEQVIGSGEELRLENYLKAGDYVEVTDGPLTGVRGFLREVRGESRVAILIDGINQSASFITRGNRVRRIEREPLLISS